MGMYWKTRSGRFSDDHATTRLGNLVISVSDFDGELQTYQIELETKVASFGKTLPHRHTVFYLDTFTGGLEQARQRAVYIARCLYYGLPIVFTAQERNHATFTPVPGMGQKLPETQIRDIWIRGIYYLPEADSYYRAEYVTNIDTVPSVVKGKRITLGPSSVVLKEIHTDHIFTVALEDFQRFGFVHYEAVDHVSKIY